MEPGVKGWGYPTKRDERGGKLGKWEGGLRECQAQQALSTEQGLKPVEPC